MMKLLVNFALLLAYFSINSAYADNVRIKTPNIDTLIVSNNLEITDSQTVINCHFNNQGTRKESVRYPQTDLVKVNKNIYSLKIKNASLIEYLPKKELLTCAYKLILVGKNAITHQVAFGEILLMGKENGKMNETELLEMQNVDYVTKTLKVKTKELSITYGRDGGIVEDI